MLKIEPKIEGCLSSKTLRVFAHIGTVLIVGIVIAACSGRSGGDAVTTATSSDQSNPSNATWNRAWDAMKVLPDWSGTWGTNAPSVDAALADCCQGTGDHLPLTAKYHTVRAAVGEHERLHPGQSNLNNIARCMPAGMPGVMSHPMLFEYLFTPGRVTLIFDDGEIRNIYTDGSQHPTADVLETSFSGHSIGHWEGKTLVADTIGITPRADIFMSNGIHSSAATHLNERMFLNDEGLLQIDTTVTDPELFVTPYAYTRKYQRVPGTFQPGCAENNRDNGADTVDLTPP